MKSPTRSDFLTVVITILICLIVVAIFVTLRYNSCNDDRFRDATVEQCISEAQTGDIVGVAYTSKRARLVRVFTGSMWIHTGIVVRTHDGTPWVLEAARYDPETKGMLASPLSEWLHYNEDHTVAWRKHIGGTISSRKLRRVLAKVRRAKVNLYVVDWLKTMYKTSYDSTVLKRGKYYCSEFVALMMQELSIMGKQYDPSGYKPWELLYSSDLPLLGEHEYEANPSLLHP